MPNETINVLTCQACDLAKTRIQVVPGIGPLDAKIMLIGEAPGQEEDKQGIPFIGKAGKRLDEILERVGLVREEMYLTNVLLCRPPRNAIREVPNSLIVCPPLWLEPSIKEIRPRVIVTMGATAAIRWFPGKAVHEFSELARATEEYVVVGSYHTSYALRMPAWVEESIVRSLGRAKGLVND